MNLTNEDQELLDRHFEHDLSDQETTIFQQKLAEDENFRQAFRLRELIHERIAAQGAARLKESLKSQLTALRTEADNDIQGTREEAPVRSLSGSDFTRRWAIAASVVVVLAAAILFLILRNDTDGGAPLAGEDSTQVENPVSGEQQQAPSYAGTDTYTSTYPIETEQSDQWENALLIIDESREEAAYRVGGDTLYVYLTQDIYPEELTITDGENYSILQINDDRYRISLPASKTDQPLEPLE